MKRILALTLAAILALSLLSGCANGATEDKGADQNIASPSDPSAEPAAEEAETKLRDDLPSDLKFGSESVRVVHRNSERNTQEIYVEEDTGDALDSAIFARNLIVEERLDIRIESIPTDDTQTYVRKATAAQSDDFDVCAAYQYYGMAMATEGILRNLNELNYLDTSKPWWAQNFISAATIGGGRLYFLTGDAALSMLRNMGTMYVNNTIWGQYFGSVSDLYSTVLEGGWTFDEMASYCETVYTDVNGNGERDSADVYGYGSTTLSMLDYTVAGADLQWSEFGEDGYPVVIINSERTVNFVEKLYRLLYENIGSYVADPSVEGENETIEKFKTDTQLFLPFRADGSERLRDMESDYAIVPLPKYDESQPAYSTAVHDSVSVFCVPITNADRADLTAAFLECFASESYRNVTDVYFETLLKEKFARDEVTAEVFDIIKNGVYFDFVLLHSSSLNNIGHMIRDVITAKGSDFASAYAKKAKVINKSLEKLIKAYQSIEG
ncbi:MAG: extracellular solute-binding protein [Firmicutes bacterium]|nr:extracellular solute-binding protein [Bacillota bacterium]